MLLLKWSMNILDDEVLLFSYRENKRLNDDPEYLQLLLTEIRKRGLDIQGMEKVEQKSADVVH